MDAERNAPTSRDISGPKQMPRVKPPPRGLVHCAPHPCTLRCLRCRSSFFRSRNRSPPPSAPHIIVTTGNLRLCDLVFASFPRGIVIPTLQASRAKVKFLLRSFPQNGDGSFIAKRAREHFGH